MSEFNRRSEDREVWAYKAMRFWPLILSVVILIGAAYVTHSDVTQAKGNISVLQANSLDHEKRLIKVETAVAVLPEMRQDLKEINAALNRIARRRGGGGE